VTEQKQRLLLDAEVKVGRLHVMHQMTGRTVEVGMDGCHIRFAEDTDFQVGSTVEVMLDARGVSIRSLAIVRRVGEGGRNLEISFSKMAARGQQNLQELLDMLPQAESKRLPEASHQEGSADQESNIPAAGKVLMRRHDRHAHRTTIWVLGVNSIAQIPGRTEDLSLGGCLISFNEPTNFAVGALVEVWLPSESGMFRVMACVRRRTENGHDLGVEFNRAHQRSAREVDKLIAGCIQEQLESLRKPKTAFVENRIRTDV
jgi:c-di-GMP-binding flagellar brake protein YcgR